jgi:hypothetical protein
MVAILIFFSWEVKAKFGKFNFLPAMGVQERGLGAEVFRQLAVLLEVATTQAV